MAHRIIYTSAPRLLQAGRSGFGVVARHKEIPQDVVEFSERISQFSRAAGFPVDRVVYAYRVFRAPSGNWHIMSRISDAGASFTGRTNHLAEHLVVDEGEVQKLIAAGGTPAGTMLAYSWPSFSGDSRWLSSTEVWEAKALRANPYGDKWAELCPDGNAKRRRLLSCASGVPPQILFEYLDRLRTAAGAKEVLQLFAESESDCPKRGWGCAFTTDLQPSDNQADFQWIGLPSSSPLAASLKASGRKLVNFRSPVPESSATNRPTATGKISPTPSIGSKRSSMSRIPRKKSVRSSWPMWLKALLGSVFGLGFVACLIIGLAIYIHAPAVSPFEVPATNPLPSAAEPELKVKTPDINSDLNVPKDAVLPPKEFEQTFLVPRVEGERPGFKTSVDDAVQSFLANSEPIEKHIEYRDWQSEDMDSQSQLEIVTPIDYSKFFFSRDIGALDLQFGSTNKTGARPLRIVELVRKKDLSNAKLPFSSAEFFVDLTGDSDEFTLLNIEGEEKSEVPSFRSGSNGELVLRAGPRLVEILGSQIGDEAILMPAHDGSIYPTLKLENARNLRLIRERFEDQAAGGDQATSVDPTLQWLDSSGASKKNLAEFLSGLREHFDLPALELVATPQASPQPSPGENKAPDLGAAFLETMNELKGSARSDAQEVGEILAPWSPETPVSQLRDDLRSELAKRRGDSMERSKKQAEKILGDHFAGGNALLPAGDYILGLRQEGRFYPAMDITITYPPENENEKRLRRDGSSQGLQTQ